MSSIVNSTLDSASSDANQTMKPTPAGSPVQSCGSAPRPDQTVFLGKTHWIAIELVNEDGRPLPGEDYRITLPDGSIVDDSLDSKGKARIEGIDPGTCKVCFPNLDKQIWKKS